MSPLSLAGCVCSEMHVGPTVYMALLAAATGWTPSPEVLPFLSPPAPLLSLY